MSQNHTLLTLPNLPTDIHLSIIDALDYPSIHLLRATNRYFRHLLSATQLSQARKRHIKTLISQEEADRDKSTRFICYECFLWKSWDKFAEKQYSKKRSKGHTDCYKRFCIECGIKRRKWHLGQFLKSEGMDLVVCRVCRLLRASDNESRLTGFCSECSRSHRGGEAPNVELPGSSMATLSMRKGVGKTGFK